jgi:hypothetical protein
MFNSDTARQSKVWRNPDALATAFRANCMGLSILIRQEEETRRPQFATSWISAQRQCNLKRAHSTKSHQRHPIAERKTSQPFGCLWSKMEVRLRWSRGGREVVARWSRGGREVVASWSRVGREMVAMRTCDKWWS